ncbi:LuxR C-terminal-related transcriptional regulator [Paraglaciecola chathamensis]|uniref:HTH luxR-type domain-containing protein n=2 Tax=Paraglaciecola chathamensis TaxID=368405 RepID=A0A8H9ICK9_9ALTE|nr:MULTISPECIES: LuxR C-terminal-related transcriptional regulator [Paraglaciecola]GGZ48554.1 hypothetical protein GCM10011274_03050 [Paraglaciecola oceanifecundans]
MSVKANVYSRIEDASVEVQSFNATLVYAHKLSPPSALTTEIARPRLLSDLLNSQNHSAVVIQGPGGFGKSTLMQQLYDQFAKDGSITGWLTFEESDNDISRFNTLLSVLFHQIADDINVGNFKQTTQMSGRSAIENLLQSLAITTKPISLFLDEFQMVTDTISLSLITTLIERCPPNVTFYIGTRAIPDFTRGRFLIGGRVKLVDAEQLSFSTEEVEEFLRLVGLDISSIEANSFREQTGGWPAVLQLLQLALKGGRVDRGTLSAWISGSESELADYLADNAMQGLSPEKIEFLLMTSLLPRLSAPLCSAITGVENSQEILEDLVSKGLFVRVVDTQKKWFKYHSLFAEYLKAEFNKVYAIQKQKLHFKAANWFYSQGMMNDAFLQAIEAEDFEMAADILAEWSPKLICNARLQTIDHWCSLLPREVISERAILCWSLAWARLFFLHRESAQEPLNWLITRIASSDEYQEMQVSTNILKCCYAFVNNERELFSMMLPQLQIETKDMPDYQVFGMSALGNLSAIYHLRAKNFVIANEHANLALSLSEKGNAAFSGAYAVALMSIALMQSGELDLALKKLKAGLHSKEIRIQGSLSTAPLSATYGQAQYEAGNFVEAESQLRDTIDTISKTLPTEWLIAAYISLARSSEFNDKESNDAMEILVNAEKLAFDRKDDRLVGALRREHIRRALIKGNLHEAKLLADSMSLTKNERGSLHCYHFTEGCDDEVICRVRLNIYTGSANLALKELEYEIGLADECEWLRRKIKLLILKSMAYDALQDLSKAREQMLLAIDLAAPRNFMATFIEEGSVCISLIEGISRQILSACSRRFIERVLEGASIYEIKDNSLAAYSTLIELPTKRELEILTLVVEGASNTEIADRLFVTANTVKFHMKNLYSKLAVNNRVKLITTAIHLGLV